MNLSNYINEYLKQTAIISTLISQEEIEKAVNILHQLKLDGGRLFILGVGGSAANASHAVNDFRKLAGIETYAPTDNVSELTARTNDDGWGTVFEEWLITSHLSERDAILVLSVGGGSIDASYNITNALKFAQIMKAKIIGIVSRDGGYTKQVADACVLIPVMENRWITPHAEGWQGIVWHLIVNALREMDDHDLE